VRENIESVCLVTKKTFSCSDIGGYVQGKFNILRVILASKAEIDRTSLGDCYGDNCWVL